MAYVRFKLSDDVHGMLKRVCKQLGMKESEMSRIALMEYMKSLGVFSEEIRTKKFMRRLRK